VDNGGMSDSRSRATVLPNRGLDQAGPELRAMLEPMIARTGYFGEMLQFLSHGEGSLAAFLRYTAALKGELPFNMVELIALTVSSRIGFSYERIQHERLAYRSGLPREWIAAASGTAANDMFSPAERLVAELAKQMCDHEYEAARETARKLVEMEGPAFVAALMFQVTRQISVGLIGHILEPELPISSIFEAECSPTDEKRPRLEGTGSTGLQES
jgi:alkylhydroperoxidase family enzyme